MNPAPVDLMPRLICVTPDEARLAQDIAAHLRGSWQVRTCAPAGCDSNAAALAAGLTLPLGNLYYLLTWLDHMAGA